MNVSMCMTRQLYTVEPGTLLVDAAMVMMERKIRRLLVTEPQPGGDRLRGILTANDIIQAFPPDVNPFAAIVGNSPRNATLTAGKIMTQQLHVTSPEAPIEEAAALMTQHKISSLPVLRDKQIAGIITESDIFRAFVALFKTEGTGARITFDVTAGEDIFELVVRLAKKHRIRVESLFRAVQEYQSVCVTRVAGERVDQFLEEIWNSGHRVLNVIRFNEPGAGPRK